MTAEHDEIVERIARALTPLDVEPSYELDPLLVGDAKRAASTIRALFAEKPRLAKELLPEGWTVVREPTPTN